MVSDGIGNVIEKWEMTYRLLADKIALHRRGKLPGEGGAAAGPEENGKSKEADDQKTEEDDIEAKYAELNRWEYFSERLPLITISYSQQMPFFRGLKTFGNEP